MNEHTLGPWEIDADETVRIVDANGATIARLGHLTRRHHGPRRSSGEVAANGRLIIAASDLLEACKKAATCQSLPDNVKDIIRAAIAKTKPQRAMKAAGGER